eukprot:602188-Pelagomonas_calceolata.AAC.1
MAGCALPCLRQDCIGYICLMLVKSGRAVARTISWQGGSSVSLCFPVEVRGSLFGASRPLPHIGISFFCSLCVLHVLWKAYDPLGVIRAPVQTPPFPLPLLTKGRNNTMSHSYLPACLVQVRWHAPPLCAMKWNCGSEVMKTGLSPIGVGKTC